jgi:hypothetical protein
MEEGEGTGITVSHDFGLEFFVERLWPGEPFATQTKELIITKSSQTQLVSFIAMVLSPDDLVTRWVQICGWCHLPLILSVHSTFSARFEGDTYRITPGSRHIVTVSFMPLQEGFCEAALELKFYDHKRKLDFVIRRTLSGYARRAANGQGRDQFGSAHALQPRPINGGGVDPWGNHSSVSTNDEQGEGEELSDTGISISDGAMLNFGIVERRHPNGPFATATSLLTIKLADSSPAMTLLGGKIRTSDGSDSACVETLSPLMFCIHGCRRFVATFEGDSRTIQPGTESTVRIIFSPKFEGLFEAELNLVFHNVRLSSPDVFRRRLQGIAGSIEDHKRFENLDQENNKGPPKNRYVPPQTVIRLFRPGGRCESGRLPDYDVPPIIQEAVDNSTAEHPYDRKARHLVSTLRPRNLTEDTYTQYFQALLNVEDGHQQCVP